MGEYMAQYIPKIAGTYNLGIKLGEYFITGSNWTVNIKPGEISASLSNHSLTSPVTMIAGKTLFFDLTMNDLYNNLIMEARDNTTVLITAKYVNHNNWTSLVPIPDFADWQSIYGKDVEGIALFNNASSPYSYKAQLTIFRAGIFTFEQKINNVHVISSPMPSGL
jgi:hypothetical protein